VLRAIALLLLFSACAPAACNADEEKVIAREVEILIGEPGAGTRQAEARLVARGHRSIAILETGLYQADPLGRQRVVKTLEKIGDREVLPILRHLARRDPDADVRERAQAALDRLASTD
jgi:HEAT repeat protein